MSDVFKISTRKKRRSSSINLSGIQTVLLPSSSGAQFANHARSPFHCTPIFIWIGLVKEGPSSISVIVIFFDLIVP